MENKRPIKNRNRREEAIAFRKECLEKGISLRDVMKEYRLKALNNKKIM